MLNKPNLIPRGGDNLVKIDEKSRNFLNIDDLCYETYENDTVIYQKQGWLRSSYAIHFYFSQTSARIDQACHNSGDKD